MPVVIALILLASTIALAVIVPRLLDVRFTEGASKTVVALRALGRGSRAAGTGISRAAVVTARRSALAGRSLRSRIRGGVRKRELRRRDPIGLEESSSKPKASSKLVLTLFAVAAAIALMILLTIRAMESLFREIVS